MWFRKKVKPEAVKGQDKAVKVPEGLWMKCESCSEIMFAQTIIENDHVCPKCNFHMRIGARKRLDFFLDPGSQQEIAAGLEPEGGEVTMVASTTVPVDAEGAQQIMATL